MNYRFLKTSLFILVGVLWFSTCDLWIEEEKDYQVMFVKTFGGISEDVGNSVQQTINDG